MDKKYENVHLFHDTIRFYFTVNKNIEPDRWREHCPFEFPIANERSLISPNTMPLT